MRKLPLSITIYGNDKRKLFGKFQVMLLIFPNLIGLLSGPFRGSWVLDLI